MSKITSTAAAVVAGLALAPLASAQVLYSDTFSRTAGASDATGGTGASDWGTNDNGLGGTLAAAYVVGPTRAGGANQSVNGATGLTIEGGAFLNLDAAAAAPAGFSVGFDFDRFAGPSEGGNGNGFLAVGLGASASAGAPAGGQFAVANGDLAVLFQQGAGGNTGNTQIFQDNALLPGTTSTGPVDYGDPLAPHSVLLTLTPRVAGAYGEADTIDASLSIDGGSDFDFAVLGGDDFGTVSFSSNGFVFRGYDNLVVTALPTTVIPEPTSLAVVGLGGLALLRRRR